MKVELSSYDMSIILDALARRMNECRSYTTPYYEYESVYETISDALNSAKRDWIVIVYN